MRKALDSEGPAFSYDAMKIRHLLLLGALAAAPICLERDARAAPLEAPVLYIEKVYLENGLRVLLETDRSTPNVAVRVRYDVGSHADPPAAPHLAHLVEHLMFRGSQHVKDGEHFERLTRLGATAMNAVTEDTSTTYRETVPARALETALWLESDRMGFALGGLTEAHFLAERQIIENEQAQRTSLRPYGAIGTEIDRELHGVRGSVRQVELEDVSRFIRDWYRPNNATITLVGNFDRDQAKGWIETYFGPIVRGDLPPQPPHHASWESRGPLRLEAGVPLAYAVLGWPLNVQSGQDECDRLLVENALQSFFSNQLRDGQTPVSGVNVSGDDSGLFLGAMGAEGATADELAQFLQDSAKRFRVADEDFYAARRAALTNFLSSLATIEGRSASYSSWGYKGYTSGIVSGVFDGVTESSARRMNLWLDDVRKNSPLVVVVSPKAGAPIAGRRVDAAVAR